MTGTFGGATWNGVAFNGSVAASASPGLSVYPDPNQGTTAIKAGYPDPLRGTTAIKAGYPDPNQGTSKLKGAS